jgi:hypothetical protein
MSPSSRTTITIRRWIVVIVAAVVASGFTLGATPAASASARLAPTCSEAECNFTDPIRTRCADATSHISMQESPAWGGTALLWRSETCQTAWSQYFPPISADWSYQLTVGNSLGQHSHFSWSGQLIRDQVHTSQLYSPGPAKLCIARAPITGGAYIRECWTESA